MNALYQDNVRAPKKTRVKNSSVWHNVNPLLGNVYGADAEGNQTAEQPHRHRRVEDDRAHAGLDDERQLRNR